MMETVMNILIDNKTLSHELRIPLTGILGMAELLIHEQGLSAEQKEEVALIIHSGTRLSSFIENILVEPAPGSRNLLWKKSKHLVKRIVF